MEINGAQTLASQIPLRNDAEPRQNVRQNLEPVQEPQAVNNAQNRVDRSDETNSSNLQTTTESENTQPQASAPQASGPTVSQQSQAQLDEARQVESDRRREESPSSQLRNQIEDIVGSRTEFNAQIDELV